MNKLLTISIVLVLFLCIFISINLDNTENFTNMNRRQIQQLDNQLIESKNNLISAIEPEKNTMRSKLDKYDQEAETISNNINKKFDELKNIKVETNYSDFGHKCMNNKKCELQNDEYNCIVKLKNRHHRTRRRLHNQSCDKILKNTQDQYINLTPLTLEAKLEMQHILSNINLLIKSKESLINLIIQKYSEKKNTLNQQSYFDNTFENMVELKNDKTQSLQNNIGSKSQDYSKEREVYTSFKLKNDEKTNDINNYLFLSKILLFIFIIILFVKGLSIQLN